MFRELSFREAIDLVYRNRYNFLFDSTAKPEDNRFERGNAFHIDMGDPYGYGPNDMNITNFSLRLRGLSTFVTINVGSLVKVEQDSFGVTFVVKSKSKRAVNGLRRLRLSHYITEEEKFALSRH